MKKSLRLIAALLVFCILAATVPPVGLAAEGTVRNIPAGTDLYDMFSKNQVNDGDTLRCADGVLVAGSHGIDNPWIIDKSVTIEDGTLTIGTGGIVLGANVTFKNTQLHFTKPICNAIVANGYTLTLDGVTASSGGYSFNLFCGTLLRNSKQTFTVPTPGITNTVIIQGNTNLQSGSTADNVAGTGNIYAGNLSLGSMDPSVDEAGAPSNFAGNPTIRIESCANATAPLGTIYASGAQQRNPVGVDGRKVTVRDLGKYTVSGNVTITGTNALPNVDGATSNNGSGTTKVVYRGDNYEATKKFTNISSLSVETGSLVLDSGSSFRKNSPLSVSKGATVNIKNMDSTLTISDFHGGGSLILGQTQTLTITGTVEGETTIGVGKIFNGASDTPTTNHKYIAAQNSTANSFQFAPPNVANPPTLEKDSNGNWTVTQPTQEVSKLMSLSPPEKFHFSSSNSGGSDEDEVFIPLNPEYTGDQLSLSDIPLTIQVDGKAVNRATDAYFGYRYEADKIHIYVADYGKGEGLSVYSADSSLDPPPDGSYTIQITVPGEYTSTGKEITASCTLTVGDSVPAVTTIPVPTANTGLKWTGAEQTGVNEGTGYNLTGHKGTDVGEYTATAALQTGYQWTGGDTEAQTISWSIGKADGPAAPSNLSAVAPTTANGSDGRITGTTSAMEYDTDATFPNAKPCSENETTGLAAGSYYVRMQETSTHLAGAYTSITVPVPGAPTVQSISVNSTAHKIEYSVGDSLDVTGLTILAVYSDSSQQTVPVTPDMVSGFNSSSAAECQTLTITYEDKIAEYTIKIIASEEPGKPKYQVTLNNLGDGGSGGGSYEEGSTVTIRAGSRSGYTFSAWQQPEGEGVALVNRNSPETSFTMPNRAVTLQAAWTLNGGTPPGHTHVWDSAWKSNDTHHWHECTASGCDITSNSGKNGYGVHVYDNAADTTCNDCGYTRTVTPPTPGHTHSWAAAWNSNTTHHWHECTASGCDITSNSSKNGYGVHVYDNAADTTCNDCGYIRTVTPPTPEHTHSWAAAWSGNAIYHWHECTASGCSITSNSSKNGYGAHIYDDDMDTVCNICGYARIITPPYPVEPSDTNYISIPQFPNGVIIPSARRAVPGERVSLYVHPDTGYELDNLTVRDVRGRNIILRSMGGDAYSFTMPSARVNVDANFVKVQVETFPDTSASGQQEPFTGLGTPGISGVVLNPGVMPFTDVKSTDWFYNSVDYVWKRYLMSGVSTTRFAPNTTTNRGMIWTILARMHNISTAGDPGAPWYERGMLWGIEQGVTDGSRPLSEITREQLATMLWRNAGMPAPGAAADLSRFSDVNSVSGYALTAVRWAVSTGIINGADGKLDPKGTATRAQAAAMVMRYGERIGA